MQAKAPGPRRIGRFAAGGSQQAWSAAQSAARQPLGARVGWTSVPRAVPTRAGDGDGGTRVSGIVPGGEVSQPTWHDPSNPGAGCDVSRAGTTDLPLVADSAPADALFGDAGDDLFGVAAGTNATSDLFDANSQQQKPTHDSSADIASVFGTRLRAVLDDYANQGWYDDDGKFYLYEDPAESYVASATATSTTQAQTKGCTPNAYMPTSYTPQTTQSPYVPPATGSGYGPPPPAAGPYASPATNVDTPQTNKYAPPSNQRAPTTNSYTPSASAYAPLAKPCVPAPPPPSSYVPSPPTASTSPSPPSGNEHLKYRSASANAYDPPIRAARHRIDSTASSASAGSPALTGPFEQTTFSPAQPTYGQLGHGAPPPPPGPPQGRNRVRSQEASFWAGCLGEL
ncbi:hypothetical protein FRC08_003109 [Ceratobasidium sp. 394]|nr:hypothetical protein FRC08_003109 [Ceratobasidium sp. 394]